MGKTNDAFFYAINFSVCVVVLLVFCLVDGFDGVSLLYGIAAGVFLCTNIVCYAKSLKTLKIAYVTFIYMLSVIVPIVYSAIWLDEAITPMKWAGFAVLAVAAYLVCFGDGVIEKIKKSIAKKSETVDIATDNQDEAQFSSNITQDTEQTDSMRNFAANAVGQERTADTGAKQAAIKATGTAIVLLLIAVVCNGALSTYIKATYRANATMNNYSFLFSTFAVSSLITGVIAAATSKGFTQIKQYVPNKLFIILALVVGIVTVFGNIAYNYFCVRTLSSVFYPIVHALPMFFAAVISPLFKEKLSAVSLVGICIGIVAIVLLSL